MAADMIAVIEAVNAAIEDSRNAPQPAEPQFDYFQHFYGPGLQGLALGVSEGLFFVCVRRYNPNDFGETTIVVSIIPDCDRAPFLREHLDIATQEIAAAIEEICLEAGAYLYYEGPQNNDPYVLPWVWSIKWAWDHRD